MGAPEISGFASRLWATLFVFRKAHFWLKAVIQLEEVRAQWRLDVEPPKERICQFTRFGQSVRTLTAAA